MRRTALLLVVVSLGAVPTVVADGMLDPSFGNGGLVITNFFPGDFSPDSALALVVLPDGRALAVGSTNPGFDYSQMAAARYLSSGALDTTFSGDGLVAVDLPGWFGGTTAAHDVLLQPDGRLVLVGSFLGIQFGLARLNVNGSLDASFGTGGRVTTPFPGAMNARALAGLLQPDGRIVAVGFAGTQPYILAAARYNVDGSLDPTFGTGGQLTLPLPQPFEAVDAALQPDGKLVIGGTYGPSSGPSRDFGLVRLMPGGAPDPSFGGDGLVTSDFGLPETGTSVILLDDGRLVLGGYRSGLPDLTLLRYLADGTLDTSFGIGGLATADAGGAEIANQVIQLPNGKLLLAGVNDLAGAQDFLLARFHPDGALDTSFGTAGFIRTDFGVPQDYCSAVAIAGPDLILTAGSTFFTDGLPDFALARYIATIPVELLAFEVE